ncbi:MAG: hypothetical protein V1719_01945 [Patescibacteria group bacterium]
MDLKGNQAQRLIERGGEFQRAVEKIIQEVAVVHGYIYPDDYAIRPVTDQISRLCSHFPLAFSGALEFVETLSTLTLPEGAEGWFAIPRWERVASSYGEAVEKVLAAIAATRRLDNSWERRLTPDCFRQNERSAEMFAKLGENQPSDSDILIVPAQFGLRHIDRSARYVRHSGRSDEFALGAFAVGCMLLTHPERIQGDYRHLWITCAGDEETDPTPSSSIEEQVFNNVLSFFPSGKDNGIARGMHRCCEKSVYSGVPSAFLIA